MCGILALFLNHPNIAEAFASLKPRGPDKSLITTVNNFTFGFHRLRINDLVDGMQPFVIDNIVLICNGEIYNHETLKILHNIQCKSRSDCEVIIYLYRKFGIKKTLQLLDGVFAFVLYDIEQGITFICRDRIGVRPLFMGDKNGKYGFASEAKALEILELNNISQIPPAALYTLQQSTLKKNRWWHIPQLSDLSEKQISFELRKRLDSAVFKRLMSDRAIGCLLSGGLDSSVVVSLLAKYGPVNTYSIGFEESTDLKYARLVAKHFKTNHHEIVLTHQEALDAIPEVIYATETYDITTIRASVGMYLLCKKIKEKYPDTVIFSGEGSDEMLCGYLYFHYSPTNNALFKESRRLLSDIHFYDALRADRCTASNGLELRVPFLDKEVVDFCMHLPSQDRKPKDGVEKYYLRKAFEDVLPHKVVWRRKEGMSDGIGGLKKPWYSFVQDYAETQISDELFNEYKDKLIQPCTKESVYYYLEFKKRFTHTPVKYHWMPKWQDTNDPSGRVLKVFKT
jgi:asparagine synthase (glutamine-hydrolysing)